MEAGRHSLIGFGRLRALLLILACLPACNRDSGSNQGVEELFQAARLAMWQGQLGEARALADRGLVLTRNDADSPQSWKLRLLLCEILQNHFENAQAAPILSAKVPDGPKYDDLRARQQYLQSKEEVAEGKLNEALRSLEVAQKTAPSAAEVQLEAAILEGQILLRLSRWNEAEAKLGAVVEQTQKDRYRQALALNNLGMGRLIRSRYDEALAWFEQVLSQTDLENMAVYGTVLYNAGICYSRLGQFERAIAVQQRAAQIHDRRGPSLQLVQALGSLGNTYVLQGDARKAVPFLRRAMDVATAANLPAESALWAGNLAAAYGHLGDWNEAERFNNEAARIGSANSSIKPVYFALNAAQIALGRGDLDRASSLYKGALAESVGTPAVTWTAHTGLARVAVSAGQPQQAARHFESALDTIEKTRSNLLRTEFKISFLTQLIEFYQAYVDALLKEQRVERAFEIVESSRGRVLAERHGVPPTRAVDLKALRTLSQHTDTVLLSYWLAPVRSSLWIVDADGIRHVWLPAEEEIEKLVLQHDAMIHNSLANPLATADTPGDRLFELLIAPISGQLKPQSPIVIVPDGILHRLNFETLPVKGEQKHYWIEDVEIQIAPSLSMLTAQRSRPALSRIAAAHRRCRCARARISCAPLRIGGNRKRVEALSAWQRRRRTRKIAQLPSAYRNAQLDRFAMIHFAAHAVANPESPARLGNHVERQRTCVQALRARRGRTAR